MKPLIFVFIVCLFSFFRVELAYASYPERIVSLAPSITKSLCLLGAEDKIIAVTVYCPTQSQHKEKIGTILEPNIEKIISLSPELVIATKEGNQIATIEKLKNLGIKVFVMEPCNSFSDICDGFLALGKLVGRENKAREIIKNAKTKIIGIGNKIRGQKAVSIFWQVGAKPLFTVSRNSFVNEFIELAGGENIFRDLKARYPQISREEVIRRDPEVIIIVAMGDSTEKEKKAWEEFRELKAVKTNSIYILNESDFTDPTPVALANGIEKVANLIHQFSKNRYNRLPK